MISFSSFQKLALSLEDTVEEPHFDKISFRIKKKIFATYDEKQNRACFKLNEIEQNIFTAMDKVSIYPVPNKWGKQGWTFIELNTVKINHLKSVLLSAYREVSSKNNEHF